MKSKEVTVDLSEFNRLPADAARDVLRPCLDVDRWIDAVVAARPFPDLDSALASARDAAHPTRDQAGLGAPGDDAQARLAAGSAADEERFDRVFLIRAAGRSPEEVLSELERRMDNSDADETAEVGEQLIQIAALRLEG